MMRRGVLGAFVGVALVSSLVACGEDSQEVPEPVDASPVESFEEVDRTEEVRELVQDPTVILAATQTDSGRLEIDTTIVDPRTDGSEEAAQAIAVCKAGQEILGADAIISVQEADGTAFVLANHPALGPDCVEY